MFGFSSKTTDKDCAIIMDIGSGSVGVGLLVIDETGSKLIWSHREQALLKNVEDMRQSQKSVSMAMVNAFLELSSGGFASLRELGTSLKPSTLQVSISAPWSYTVLRSIQYTDEHPFTVDDALIQELVSSAQKQSDEIVQENDLLHDLELCEISQRVVGMRLNGYEIHTPQNQKGRSFTVSYIYSVAQNSLIQALRESQSKIVPAADVATYPFIFVLYSVCKELQPHTSESCLVDVSNEATQIGIVRNGSLSHTTHIDFGLASIAREIAQTCKIPIEEAYTYMKGDDSAARAKLSAEQQSSIDDIYRAYEKKLSDLFSRTGDELSVPKSLFLHTDVLTESFFSKRLKNAAKAITKQAHTVHPVTTQLLNDTSALDTALLLSAHFYKQQRATQ